LNSTSSLSILLQNFDLGAFLTQNKHLTAEKYLLRSKGNTNELNWLLAEQINLYPKALRKLPQFAHNHCWFTSKSYEQSSGEALANFKASLVKGRRMLDLSGGLGVDDWAFSRSFTEIISLDPDIFLNELVRTNYKKMDINSIVRLDITAEEYLQNTNIGKFDLIFLDADRRPDQKRAFFLDQCTPNILELHARCLEVSEKIMLKISPMVDISYLTNVLSGIEKIWVIGDKQEVKEILVLLGKNKIATPQIYAVQLLENETLIFPSYSKLNEVNSSPNIVPNSLCNYIFEPHPCIIKAGISQEYAESFGLNQLAPQSFLFTGSRMPENFIGRAFVIKNTLEFSKSTLSNYLKENRLVQANITRRNFKQSVEEIRKVFKIEDGGDDYLFFSTNAEGKRLVFHVIKA
jgi:hypothetical protein